MKSPVILALDIGTSSTRSAIYGRESRTRSQPGQSGSFTRDQQDTHELAQTQFVFAHRRHRRLLFLAQPARPRRERKSHHAHLYLG